MDPEVQTSPMVEKLLHPEPDNGSGHGKESVIPEGVAGWGWGPFFWNFIWAIPNGVPMGLLALVPYAGFIVMFLLGKKGRVWAWQNKKWKSVEDFNRVQRIWSISGFVFFVIMVVVVVWAYYTISAYINNLVIGNLY